MVMPLADLRTIYELLFRDGVMVVIRAMGSKGFVWETFAWKHSYWYLTNEGILYLRDYLRLPPEIVPSSLQHVRRPRPKSPSLRPSRNPPQLEWQALSHSLDLSKKPALSLGLSVLTLSFLWIVPSPPWSSLLQL
uniref:Plectin/eS10 N-terminal domain-containing protein n=1 Tax=Hucho hucho TaxID=62062 RepID=A0A4W5RTK3_9TELE